MSENKISDTLEFDDDIDFEGLDECSEESDDSADDKSESFDDDLTEETKNDAYNVSYEQEQNNIVHNILKFYRPHSSPFASNHLTLIIKILPKKFLEFDRVKICLSCVDKSLLN